MERDMTGLNLPAEGGCRCGRVRIRITAAPLVAMACHCRGCQKMSSSAFSLSAAIPADGFAVTEGEPVIGGLHGATRHYFCPHCMSWMFTRPEGMDWFVNVRATMLDDPGWYAPFIETWTSEKLAFAQTGAPHSYEALPPLDAYEGLMKEYAEWAK
jgi:hypothetical protein